MSDSNFQGSQPYSGQFTNPSTGQTDHWGHTTTSPTKKHRRWPWVVLVVVAVLGVLIAANGGGDKEPSAQPAGIVASTYVPPAFTAAPATPAAPRATIIPRTTAPKPVASPLSTDGTYKVGAQVQPGDYSFTIRSITGAGYWETCATIACEITFDGSDSGMIDNGFETADGYLTIPPNAAFVKLQGLTLTPA